MSILTLLTDFGITDATTGMAKGILYSRLPGTSIIDVSHQVPAFQPSVAGYLLGAYWQQYPPGTVHLVLADVYYAPHACVVALAHQGSYFIAPAHSVLPIALRQPQLQAHIIAQWSATASMAAMLGHIASVAASMQQGVWQPSSTASLQLSTTLVSPTLVGDSWVADVLYVDHFGNVVTNIHRSFFEANGGDAGFQLQFMWVNEITELTAHYADVALGEHLCRFNRAGYLEICINQGSAASLLGFRLGGKYNDIKIKFK